MKRSLKVILIIFIVLSSLYTGLFLYSKSQLKKRIYEKDQTYNVDQPIYPYEEISFKSIDGLNLYGELQIPKNPKGIIIAVPGWATNHEKFNSFCDYLYEKSYACFKLDLRYQGNSEGEYISAAYLEHLDVKGAINYVASDQRINTLELFLVGSSMGGATVLNTNSNKVSKIVSLAGYSDFIKTAAEDDAAKKIPGGSTLLKYVIKPYLSYKYGAKNLVSPLSTAKKMGDKPIMQIHAKEDATVPYSEALTLQKALKNNPNFKLVTLEGDNHTPWVIGDDFNTISKLNFNVIDKILEFIANN